MASRVQWRKFAFFERDTLLESLNELLGGSLTCACSEGGLLLFGDAKGVISVCDSRLSLSFKQRCFRGAVRGVAYIDDYQNTRKSYIVAIGEESTGATAPSSSASSDGGGASPPKYAVKIYVASDVTRPIQAFIVSHPCITTPSSSHASTSSTYAPASGPYPVLTAFASNSDATQLSMGFSNGAVLLYAAHFLQEAFGKTFTPHVLLPSHPYPVSALHPCELAAGSSGGSKASTSIQKESMRQSRLFVVMDTETASTASTSVSVSSSMGNPGVGQSGRVGSAGTNPSISLDASASNFNAIAMQQDEEMGGVYSFDTSTPVPSPSPTGPPSYGASSSSGSIGGGGYGMPPAVSLPKLALGARLLDERGASANCSSLVRESVQLVLARAEGVFLYTPEDRGGAAGFEGDKQCVTAVGRYILVGTMDTKSRRVMITIYDLRNKYITMSHLLAPMDNVHRVVHDNGTAYVVTSSGAVVRFKEKDTVSKIDVLLKKSLHSLGIALALEEQAPIAEVMKLYKGYGDYLLRRNDLDGAMAQYCNTIGFVPSSYVIRHFLDAQKLSYLTTYLEALHNKGHASKDLTTLLLTCYTKMREEERINAFVHAACGTAASPEAVGNSTGTTTTTNSYLSASVSLQVDVEAAISILREAGYVSSAMRLALFHGDHDGYLSMLLSTGTNASSTPTTTTTTTVSSSSSSSGNVAPLDAGSSAIRHLVAIISDIARAVNADAVAIKQSGNKLRTVTRRTYSKGISTMGLRVTEATSSRLDNLLVLLRRHGRAALALRPDEFTGMLILLCTGVLTKQLPGSSPSPASSSTSTTANSSSGSNGSSGGRGNSNPTSSSGDETVIDFIALLRAIQNATAFNAASLVSAELCASSEQVLKETKLVPFLEPLFAVEDLVGLFIEDHSRSIVGAAGSGPSSSVSLSVAPPKGVHVSASVVPAGWQRRYLIHFLEGVSICKTGLVLGASLTSSFYQGSPGASATPGPSLTASSNTSIGMRGASWLSSSMTDLLIELFLYEHEHLQRLLNVQESGSRVVFSESVFGASMSTEELRTLVNSLQIKIMNILDGTVPSQYDASQALLLSYSFDFKAGINYLLEKSQSVDLVLARMREAKDHRGIMRILRREGQRNPELFLDQLRLYVLDSIKAPVVAAGDGTFGRLRRGADDSDDEEEDDDDDGKRAGKKGSRGKKEGRGRHGGSASSGSESNGGSDSSSSSSSSDEDSEEESSRFEHIEELLELLQPIVMFASSGDADTPLNPHDCVGSGRLSIRQILPILALNPELPLSVASDLIQATVRGCVRGNVDIEKDCYKMRLVIDALVKERQQEANKSGMSSVSVLGGSSSKSSNPFADGQTVHDRVDDDSEFGGNKSLARKARGKEASRRAGSSRRRAPPSSSGSGAIPYLDDDETTSDDEYAEGEGEAGDDEEEGYERMVRAAEAAREKQHWEAIKRAQTDNAHDHEAFYAELEASTDGFGTLASYFCKKEIV